MPSRLSRVCAAASSILVAGARNTLYLEFPWTVAELAEVS
jgi:hypothetical protein